MNEKFVFFIEKESLVKLFERKEKSLNSDFVVIGERDKISNRLFRIPSEFYFISHYYNPFRLYLNLSRITTTIKIIKQIKDA